MKSLYIAICLFGLSFVSSQNVTKPDVMPTLLGQTPLKHAAFVSIYQTENTTLSYEDRWTLYISTFDPLQITINDDVWYMRSPGSFLDNVTAWADNNIEQLDKSAVWANKADYMPSSVVGVEGIVQTSGFLVTGKQDGQLQMYDTTTEPPTPDGGVNIAANDSNEWSYHRVVWQDMDLDGDLDAVTCRFHLPLVGDVKTEFIVFENPDQGMVPEWTEKVISSEGPDIHFTPVQLSAGGIDYDCFIFAEFFAERLTIYYTESPGVWTDLHKVVRRIIDPFVGQIFDVVVDDINRDGVDDLIATVYNTTSYDGSVRVYQFPANFITDDWEYEVIATGFKPHNISTGSTMSPGTIIPFYPSVEYEEDVAADGLPHKPFILLSGDDDGRMYILDPQSDDRANWNYTKNILVDRVNDDDTSGTMAPADLDGDGYTEIVTAAYSVGQLNVFSYAP